MPLVFDSFSRWCEALPLKLQVSSVVSKALLQKLLVVTVHVQHSCFGQRIEFSIEVSCSHVCIFWHYSSSHELISPSNKQYCGTIELYHRMYANIHPNWPKLLAVNRMTFRMSPATQFSQYSPYGLVFGKQMRLPIDTSLSPNTTVSKDLNLEKKLLHCLLENASRNCLFLIRNAIIKISKRVKK